MRSNDDAGNSGTSADERGNQTQNVAPVETESVTASDVGIEYGVPDFGRDYWDLHKVVETADTVYVDWEGFTGPDELAHYIEILRRLVRMHEGDYGPTYVSMIADLTLHWVHENVDQADYEPTEDEMQTVFYALYTTFIGRYHMKSEIDYMTDDNTTEGGE